MGLGKLPKVNPIKEVRVSWAILSIILAGLCSVLLGEGNYLGTMRPQPAMAKHKTPLRPRQWQSRWLLVRPRTRTWFDFIYN